MRKARAMTGRRDFLLACAAAGAAPAMLGAQGGSSAPEPSPLGRALVLSGGGARGAYEAGLVGGLAARDAIPDGVALRDYDLVCGTSIGALNGWFVATGQYARLKDLWYGISGDNLIAIKRQYAALRDPESGLIDRALAAWRLRGLVVDQKGVLEAQAVFAWIARHVDPARPVLVPLVWAVTNLSTERPEYFYVRPANAGEELPAKVRRALVQTLGPNTVVREATPETLQSAIFASAAIPIAFDPVRIPGDDPRNVYCDGGVASNSPVGIAHAVASAADVVLLDPPMHAAEIGDAMDIAFGVYGTMQRKLLEGEMRSTYFQSVGKRVLQHVDLNAVPASQERSQAAEFVRNATATDLRYIRPEKTLPVGVVEFENEAGIGEAFRLGWQDVTTRGFSAYDWLTFEL